MPNFRTLSLFWLSCIFFFFLIRAPNVQTLNEGDQLFMDVLSNLSHYMLNFKCSKIILVRAACLRVRELSNSYVAERIKGLQNREQGPSSTSAKILIKRNFLIEVMKHMEVSWKTND
jgi:hypothetical protein